MRTIISLTIILISISSCGKPENKFLNLEKANNEILKSTGISIFKFRDKVHNDFEVGKYFYDSISYNSVVNNSNAIFEKYGFIKTKDNGDTIRPQECDSIQARSGLALSKGFILNNCEDKSDSSCIVKNEWYELLSKLDNHMNIVSSQFTEHIYFDLYKKEYITNEEFEFITLWEYILVSCQNLEDEEWLENKKNK